MFLGFVSCFLLKLKKNWSFFNAVFNLPPPNGGPQTHVSFRRYITKTIQTIKPSTANPHSPKERDSNRRNSLHVRHGQLWSHLFLAFFGCPDFLFRCFHPHNLREIFPFYAPFQLNEVLSSPVYDYILSPTNATFRQNSASNKEEFRESPYFTLSDG